MGKTHRALAAFLLACAATTAHAADAPMLVADARAAMAQPRFISLTSARNGTAGVRVVNAPQSMRSDRVAMNSGFMRLDRERLQRVRPQTQRPVHAAVSMTPTRATPIASQRPVTGDSAVLDLFGETGSAQAQTGRFGRVAHSWPLPADAAQKFTSAFGMRKDPFHGRDSFHGGIDLAAAVGTSVLATADGTVTKVENGSRYGKYVTVQHKDGSESSYGHLSAQSVRVGQHVRQGQKVGEVGATGRATGPHLDYRMKKNGELINPMAFLPQQPRGVATTVASNDVPAPTRHVSTINGVKIIR